MCPCVRVRACVCVSVLARAQKQGSRWFGQVLPGNDSSSSSSSKASGPRILAPRDRGIGGKAEPPSVSDGPLSSPWEPALELGRARPGRQEIAESSGTASPAYPSGVSAGDPALLYPPSSGYPRKAVIGSSELPQSCFPRRGQRRRQKPGNLLSRSEQVRLRGLGLARRRTSHRPHGLG